MVLMVGDFLRAYTVLVHQILRLVHATIGDNMPKMQDD